jgi:hypothetical protein
VTIRATRCVADYHHAASQKAVADDSYFTIVLACGLDLKRHAGEDDRCVFEVQSALFQRPERFSGS